MAGPLPCDNHSDRMATTLITDLENGNSLTLCGDCLVEFAAMLAEQLVDRPLKQTELTEGAQEAADLEPVAPAPDAEPKSGPEDEEDDAAERTYPPPLAQETPATGE